MKPPKVETTRGTPATITINQSVTGLHYPLASLSYYAEFSFTNDRVSVTGRGETLQDIRDALRELLRELEEK